MRAYHPEEHEESQSVAPLLQFFELAHVGDTMQSMIQVYFDKELVGPGAYGILVFVADLLRLPGVTYRSYRLPQYSCSREEALRRYPRRLCCCWHERWYRRTYEPGMLEILEYCVYTDVQSFRWNTSS